MAKYAIIKSFYASENWINFRQVIINERIAKYKKIICDHCKKEIIASKDIILHHTTELTPENVQDYNISLNPEKIEVICFDCHNKEHKRFGYRPERKVYIVFGAPLSGKHTFVKDNMQRGDLVVDMDNLYAAVTMLPSYDKPDSLFSNVIGIHNLLIDNIKTRYGKWSNAWIIGGYADKFKRERIATELGAEIVFCDISKEECLRRLEVDLERRYRKDEWSKYINKWFEDYRP